MRGAYWAWIAEGQVPEKVGNTPHPHSVVEEDLGLFSVSLVSLASLNQPPKASSALGEPMESVS